MTAYTRTAYTYSAASGDILTAANVQKIPGGLVAYEKFTTGSTTLSSSARTTLCSISITLQKRMYLLVGFATYKGTTTMTTPSNLYIVDSGLGDIQVAPFPMSADPSQPQCVTPFVLLKVDPADTSARTIKLEAAGGVGGTHTLVAGTDKPALLAIYDAGPTF